jgi:indole-3-glycerol phosphate synthase
MSADFLASMAASSHARVAQARRMMGEAELMRWAEASPQPPSLVLSPQGFDVIAEVKLRSPAVGQLKGGDEDVAGRVGAYAGAGAAAVSVLTEPERFEGSLDHLEQASRALAARRVPTMRKDFLVEPYQVAEARLAGAGGILVIVRMLDRDALLALVSSAKRLGLFVLVECFDENDIGIAIDLAASPEAQGARLLLGVNSRDLVTLKVVPGRLEQLAPRLPAALPRVAESGVATPADAARLAACGYDLALLRDMIEAGRKARAR